MVVLDASALLAVAFHEPGRDIVLAHIRRSGSSVLIHSVNAFEVVTKLCYRGIPEADAWAVVELHDITRVDEVGEDVLHNAVRLKLASADLSLGDCVCIAFAEYTGGVCVTSDKRFRGAKTTAPISLFRE